MCYFINVGDIVIKIIKEKKNMIIFIGIFIILTLWVSAFPLIGDDWGWGDSFKNILFAFKNAISLWTNYNGRVLGHVLVFFMSSYPIAKNIIIALTFSLLIYIISIFSRNKQIKLPC